MGQPSFFDNVREWIGGVAFAIYLWSAQMTKEQFWAAQEKQAVEQNVQADGAWTCPECGRSDGWHEMGCETRPSPLRR